MQIGCLSCCGPGLQKVTSLASAFAYSHRIGLPASLLADLVVWYKFDGLPGETFITDYSGNERHASMTKNTQTLDYDSETIIPGHVQGLKWGPAVGAGTVHSFADVDNPPGIPKGNASPNLISAFFVINPFGGGSFNFQENQQTWKSVTLHGVSYLPFNFYYSRAGGGSNPGTVFAANNRGTTSEVARARSEQDVPYSTLYNDANWRLINYKRQGAGSNHHMRINRKVQALTVVAGDYVNDGPDVMGVNRMGSGSNDMFTGYQAWLMVFNRNLTSTEELLVEDYIYDQMALRSVFLVDLP